MAIDNDGEIIYSDVNLDLGSTSSYELLYNEQAVVRSILNILGTNKGTRPFRRNFGASLLEILFDPLDEITAKRLRLRLMQDILQYEPRVTVQDVEVVPDYDLDAYYVNVTGWMVRLNNRPLTFNFNLRRNQS